MPKKVYTVVLEFHEDNFSPIVEQMQERALNEQLFAEPFKSICHALQRFIKLTTFYDNNRAALTRKLFFSFDPTDSFRMYSAAFLTLDFESFIIEHKKFLSSLYTQCKI